MESIPTTSEELLVFFSWVFAGAIMPFLDFKSFEPSQKLRIINTTKNREQITHVREMGGLAMLVAHLLATAAVWVRIQTSFKNTKWATLAKDWLARPKSIQKKNYTCISSHLQSNLGPPCISVDFLNRVI
jgi:hypothetical protein